MSNRKIINDFDCIVIGGGHAGVEAAHAAAKIGARTALITISKDTIAKMSCNPAIGGLAKGQIAHEVDALGGLMGLAIDATGIQFRMLNRSKGEAVQSPRAQADRAKYQEFMLRALEETANLTIVEAIAAQIMTQNNQVRAVKCKDGSVYHAETVVVTPGTIGLFGLGRLNNIVRWWLGRIGGIPGKFSYLFSKLGVGFKEFSNLFFQSTNSPITQLQLSFKFSDSLFIKLFASRCRYLASSYLVRILSVERGLPLEKMVIFQLENNL